MIYSQFYDKLMPINNPFEYVVYLSIRGTTVCKRGKNVYVSYNTRTPSKYTFTLTLIKQVI